MQVWLNVEGKNGGRRAITGSCRIFLLIESGLMFLLKSLEMIFARPKRYRNSAVVALIGLFAPVLSAGAGEPPPAAAFQVLPPPSAEAPVITPYLKYQTEMAWKQDDVRRLSWEGIRSEQDLLRIQKEIRANLLAMLGGLPAHKTPLNPHITGKIQMDGFHIEKLIFESLPGVYVSALVYLPDDESKKHHGILVPAGHS